MDKNKKSFQHYARYSGMAFQILGAILLGSYVGYWIDAKLENEQAIATASCALIGVLLGLYVSLKDLIKNK